MFSERSDEGQMMLLAAIVLLVAFLALTTLVARVSVVEQETGREISPEILREAEIVGRAFCAFPASVSDLIELEAQRGFLLSQAAGVLTLSDAQSSVQFAPC